VTDRLLLDVSSMFYRAYFAMKNVEIVAPDGRPVGALHGYLDMVTRLLVQRRPHEVVHVYDHDWRPVARTDIYARYKAERPDEPEELTVQFSLLREVLAFTDMPQAQAPDWEAEDAIGGLCARAEPEDRIEIVSGDRDLLQLVRDRPPAIKVLFTIRGVSELHEFDEAAVLERYEVPASRYAEFAILRGDPSDGLPGVQGVGEKTARALIQAYPSLAAILEDAAASVPQPGPLKGKPALRARLLEAAPYLEAMQRLVPINAEAELMEWAGDRWDEALRGLAEETGLRGPVQRLLAALDAAGRPDAGPDQP
jgi:5'-3' exonuclease